MGTNPEHISPEAQDEHVTWIGRDRLGFDRPPVPEAPGAAAPPGAAAAGPSQESPARKWLLPAGVV
ncbi:MAG: hypothetical protein WCA14_01000, partial [Steroidobacteraceae bacterium]